MDSKLAVFTPDIQILDSLSRITFVRAGSHWFFFAAVWGAMSERDTKRKREDTEEEYEAYYCCTDR